MHQGGCQCHYVRYEYSGEPLTCYACHCTDCQTSTGTSYTLSLIVKREDVVVVSGEVAVNRFQQNGRDLSRHHCPECGTGLWFSAAEYPKYSALKPGTFDDTSWFRPIAHLWVRSKQPWVQLESSIKQYQQQPEMRELVKLWSAVKMQQ